MDTTMEKKNWFEVIWENGACLYRMTFIEDNYCKNDKRLTNAFLEVNGQHQLGVL